jgi:DNA transformation protein
MSVNAARLEELKDTLARLGFVSGRRMFGGMGVYLDGVFFAIIGDGVVYFKAAERSYAAYEAEGSRHFTYKTRKGRAELHSYWRAPERLLDDPEDMIRWAERALKDARLARQAKTSDSQTAVSCKNS